MNLKMMVNSFKDDDSGECKFVCVYFSTVSDGIIVLLSMAFSYASKIDSACELLPLLST